MDAQTSAYPDMAAERCGDIDLYLQRVTASDGVILALWRCGIPPHESDNRPPVVLVHGSYTNRRFWLSSKGRGLASWLMESGFDVWLAETRGHGASDGGPKRPHARASKWTIEDVVRHDLPAIHASVAESNPTAQFWVGHSYGGVYAVGALSLQTLPGNKLAGLVIAGSQVKEGQRWLRHMVPNLGVRGLTRALGRFPAKALGMGNEDEPPGISNEALLWKRTGRWQAPSGTEYGIGLPQLQIPMLAIAGCGDRMDPVSGCEEFIEPIASRDLTLWKLGRNQGWLRDYGHVDMIIGKESEQEVWPAITQWLNERKPFQAVAGTRSAETTPAT